jgi:hypothetical protein
MNAGHFYAPLLRKRRRLRTYDATPSAAADAKSSCFWKPGARRNLAPGIFTVLCEHGICLGFSLMRQFESEYHAFEVFFSRMQQGARCRAVCFRRLVLMRALFGLFHVVGSARHDHL